MWIERLPIRASARTRSFLLGRREDGSLAPPRLRLGAGGAYVCLASLSEFGIGRDNDSRIDWLGNQRLVLARVIDQ